MKTRELQALGFEAVVTRDGRVMFMLPLAKISDAGAVALAPTQLLEIMRINLEDGKKSLEKLQKKLSGPAGVAGA